MDHGYRTFWAKSGDAEHPEGHPLMAHMLDTAAVARALLLREPRTTRRHYADDFGLDEDRALRLAAFFAGLHDLGKATAIFQVQWPDGAARLRQQGLDWMDRWLPRRGDKNWAAHGVLTEVLTPPLLVGLGVPDEVASQVAVALGAHHGFVSSPGEVDLARDALDLEDEAWQRLREELVGALWRALGAEPPTVRALSPQASLRVMALASFADWVASSPEHFPYGRDLSDLSNYLGLAGKLANQALDRIGWLPRTALAAEDVSFEEVFPDFRANALQQQVVTALDRARGPTLIVIEAPMGGGKTEAALYAHTVLQARNGHRGLYVAMPTTATGNAMFQRVKKALLDKFGDRPHDLQLVHGASLLNADYLSLKHVGEPGDDGTVQAAAWFSAKKRALLSEYGVGTVDQALLGVLRVKHHFVRLWGLGNRTVVLDEVHAYDAYTSRLIAGLVRWLWELGSSVIIMSATLTRHQRAQLAAACGAGLPESEAAYPRITVYSQNGLESLGFRWDERKTVGLEAAPTEVGALSRAAAESVRSGGVAALIVNTVDRAQQAYLALGPGEPIAHEGKPVGKRIGDLEVYLFHARYPSIERGLREKTVLGVAGKGGRRPRKALVIATQVIEQSLDLDFDVAYSDLAPLDLLLQRAGRLHRHPSRTRPPKHARPVLHVAGLGDAPPAPLPKGWGRPYMAYPLLSTWLLLHTRDRLTLPDDIEPLVEATYDARTLDRFPEGLRDVAAKALAALQEQTARDDAVAHNAVLDPPTRLLEKQLANLHSNLGLDDDEESDLPQVALTRLGEPSITVVPAYRMGDELFLDREGVTPLPAKGRLTKEEVFQIAERSIRVSRPGVYRALVKAPPPAAWKTSSILRSWRVLELDANGTARFGGTAVRLDPELGLQYTTVDDAKEG